MATLTVYSINQLEQEFEAEMEKLQQLMMQAGVPIGVATPGRIEARHLESLDGKTIDALQHQYYNVAEVKYQLDKRQKQVQLLVLEINKFA